MRGPDPSLRCAPFRMTSVALVQDDKWGVGSERVPFGAVQGLLNGTCCAHA